MNYTQTIKQLFGKTKDTLPYNTEDGVRFMIGGEDN